MEKSEALNFIGLHEPLTEEAVLSKYTERFNYYHMLYSNAPSKVIEKIQQQNLEKLKQVKKILLDEIATKKNAFEKRFLENVVQPKPETERQAAKKMEAGWLIVHTENRKTETFSLYEGVNFIGRKKRQDGANSIVLLNDPFVSRTHAFIKAKRYDNSLQFALYDGDGSKLSINGVYLNGKETRVNQFCSLEEGDTIQVGRTKLVLKIKKENRSLTGEVDDVMKTGYIRTIDLK